MSELKVKTKQELKQEEKAKNREKLKEENEKLNPPISIGLDIGTMNLVCARSDSENVKMTRNVFLKVDKENISINEMSNINYIENGDDIFIIGDDAFQFANIFGTSVARPMEKGLISPKEISAIDVLTLMLKGLIGDVSNKDVYVTYSIPASAIDENRSVTYHTKIFARILGSIGLNYSSLNEAMAIIYSECAKENYSGIAISFGAGMANCIDGETKIPLLDGSIKTIKELCEHGDDKFWVYSCKEDGTITPGLAYNPRKTGTKEIIRIHLDNDTYLDCTEDHLIMTRDGKFIKANELKENNSLMPLYTRDCEWIGSKGYLQYYNNKHKYWHMVHSMVRTEYYNIYLKKGYVTHHKNFNKKDNRPENLIICDKKAHRKFHKEVAKIGGLAAAKKTTKRLKGKTFEEIYGIEKATNIKKKLSNSIKNSTAPQTLKKQRIGQTFNTIFGKEKSNIIKNKMSKKKKGLSYKEIMNDEKMIEKRISECSEQCNTVKPWLYRKNKINGGTFKKHQTAWNKGLTGNEYKDHYKDGMKNQYSNHKVVKIEKLNIFKDVYDLSVHEHHNFAINNGIFIHNCAISFRGVEALTFSTARSGDWIDQQVAADLDMVPNRVTNIKEKYVDLSGNFNIKNKKTKRVVEALFYYYQSMIDYTIKQIIKEFDKKVDMEIDDEIPIVISGGTSLPKGFVTLFKNVIDSKEIPFQISEIRRAKNPLTSVANGLLIKTMADVKNILISKT